ncbi:MAG: ATP-binding cassette domain-containing protein [Bacterioplanes sp.]|nr:ATP-binding cassette domain-containing protein [Bacterioplanes sp.]
MVALMTLTGIGVTKGQSPILSNIDMAIQPGELLMLVGPNGAGKSTLLSLLAGLSEPSCGTLSLQQRAGHSLTRREWANWVAFVPQLTSMGFPLTVEEVIALGDMGNQQGVVQQRRRLRQALTSWELDYFAQQEVRVLSGGEQQRTQLARSWLQATHNNNQLWLLDEPLSALDLRHQQQCMQHIMALKAQGKSIVMVVHDLNLARRFADRVALLRCGQLVACGAPAEVLTLPQVQSVFQVDVQWQSQWLSWS